MPTSTDNDVNVLEYSSKDFVNLSIPWLRDNDEFVKSKFDNCLCCAWEDVKQDGVCLYNLDEVLRKTLPGKYAILAQLNTNRFTQRRKPEESTEVMMPFNSNKFNFNKIKTTEILFDLKRMDESELKDRLIINVSPIEYGHVLIIPRYKQCLPQVLDSHAIQVACEICLLTSHRGFCMGFNSLCALASVNHLHLHAMYMEHRLPIHYAGVKHLIGNVFILDKYMVNGYVLQLRDGIADMKEFSKDVIEITSYLTVSNIPHNIAICRREKLDEASSEVDGNDNDVTCVTVFILPKKMSPEMTDDAFNCAFIELAGLLVMGDLREYEDMTEAKALQIFSKYTYSSHEFEVLTKDLLIYCSSTEKEM